MFFLGDAVPGTVGKRERGRVEAGSPRGNIGRDLGGGDWGSERAAQVLWAGPFLCGADLQVSTAASGSAECVEVRLLSELHELAGPEFSHQ